MFCFKKNTRQFLVYILLPNSCAMLGRLRNRYQIAVAKPYYSHR